MASEYRIHRPYVLAALPRPLDHTDGRIVAREVYGQRDLHKKRKRTEVVVGIDGESTAIYDARRTAARFWPSLMLTGLSRFPRPGWSRPIPFRPRSPSPVRRTRCVCALQDAAMLRDTPS